MFKVILKNVKAKSPLIHNITNYVTVNDCANILLACGSSPIMSDDVDEVEEITAICDGLNINIGTLNQRTIPAMYIAAKKANELGHPVILDPVGAGASTLRTNTAIDLVENVKFSVIRGNISEIRALAHGEGSTRGVDADISETVTRENLTKVISFAKEYAKKTGAIIVITGAIDIVANTERVYCIFNGHPMMSSITGTGCQLSAMIAAYVTANPETPLEAAATAVCLMGVCGEKAHGRLGKEDGNVTYRNYIIDSIYNLSLEELEDKAKIEIY